MNRFAIEIKWGIIYSCAVLAWMSFEKAIGLHDEKIDRHANFTLLFAIPSIAIFVLAILDKKRNYYSGYVKWKDGFKSGMMVTMIVVILSPVIQYIIHTLITPDFFRNVIEYSVNHGGMKREEAEGYFNLKNYMIQSVISALVMGTIISALVSVFLRKEKSNFTGSY